MDNHAVVFGHHVAVKIGLLTTLVVGIGRLDAIAWCPFVVVGPAVCVFDE